MSTAVAEFEHRFADYLARLGHPDVSALLGVLDLVQLQPGDEPIRQGERSDRMLFVEWGDLVILVDDRETARVTAGQIAGEVGLLSPGPATATVRATEPTTVHVLTHDALDRLSVEHPNVASSILQGVTRVLAERLRRIEGDVDDLDGRERRGLLGLLDRLFSRAA